MKEFTLNKDKAINSLLYICESQGGYCDMYTLLKIVFFADSQHLFTYGRPITGDTMWSMERGPVPSFCYDTVKSASVNKKYFISEDNVIEATLKPEINLFSESDLECLDASIKDNVNLPFKKLLNKSHTSAYEKTVTEKGLNKPISYLDIAKEDGKVNEDMLTYISSRFEY